MAERQIDWFGDENTPEPERVEAPCVEWTSLARAILVDACSTVAYKVGDRKWRDNNPEEWDELVAWFSARDPLREVLFSLDSVCDGLAESGLKLSSGWVRMHIKRAIKAGLKKTGHRPRLTVVSRRLGVTDG